MEQQGTNPAGSTDQTTAKISIPVGARGAQLREPSSEVPGSHTVLPGRATIEATGALQDMHGNAGVDVQEFAGALQGSREKIKEPARAAIVRSTRGRRARLSRLWATKKIVDQPDPHDLENPPEHRDRDSNTHEQQSEAAASDLTDKGKDEDGLGRQLFSTIFRPMGLWVDSRSRKLIDDGNRANGFPRVTTFIASDPDGLTSIYRRFDKLNVRNLLLLEAKVAALEELQEKFDIEDADGLKGERENNFSMGTTHSSFEYFALLGEGKDVIETDDSGSMGEDEGGSKNPAQLNHGDGGENAREVSRLRSLSEPVDAREADRLRSLSEPLDERKTDGTYIRNMGQIDQINLAKSPRDERLSAGKAHEGSIKNTGKIDQLNITGNTRSQPSGSRKAHEVSIKNTGKIDQLNIMGNTRSQPSGSLKVNGVHINNESEINQLNISGIQGTSSQALSKSGIPVCAFRKWNESREKVLRDLRSDIEAGAATDGMADNAKQALIQAVTEENRRYWQDRWEVAQAIQHSLKEYQEAVILHNKMLKLDTPTKGTVRALRKYVGGAYYMKEGVEITTKTDQQTGERRNLRPPQFLEDSAVTKMLKDDDDFVSLHPPGDDDLGTWLAAKCFGWLLKRRGDDNPEFDDVSEIAVGRFTTVWTFFVAIGFLMGAVWFIWRVGLEEVNVEVKFERKLAILTAFTGLFGGWVALFTSAKRYEIFGATAAYAAVLIVFVGVDPGDAIGP
ncbi:hypothetical protein L207DRAFT_590966 [Hyaloscypha variabilis F]|uniref:DUF6594 domain-containing protein n=1 Tax=Hyaloscypha variabilis (strain UAMH 11265 / GT02V1 / F) TaxID=1149755 RepID=A0A2J6R0Q1_HYAVF|nr:hypothetical protein L207DRAFT_590966 [Hyaloscypha variabilis F]